MLGAESAGYQAVLPSAWFDPNACHCLPDSLGRGEGDASCNWSTRRLAFEYCTGTLLGGALNLSTNLSSVPTTPTVETWLVGTTQPLDSLTFPPPLDANQPRLQPMITAYQEQVSWYSILNPESPNVGSWILPIADRDTMLLQYLAGLPLWYDQANGFLEMMSSPEDIVPICGPVQRWTFWNQSCGTLLSTSPSPLNVPGAPQNLGDAGLVDGGNAVANEVQDPLTGGAYLSSTGPSIIAQTTPQNPIGVEVNGSPANRCSIREARTLITTCPGSATCGSGGSCVFGRANLNGGVVVPPHPPVTLLTSPF
jgi:hypothetical protein